MLRKEWGNAMAETEKTGVEQRSMIRKGREGEGKYFGSFVWMLLFTGVSFALVGMNFLPGNLLIPVILLLAALQVLMQLFSFMHLDFKGYLSATVFMGSGCIVAATAIIAMLFWV